jgi:hypothetical protein
MQAPAVYCFTCPDGRRYVGSTGDHRTREALGLARSNPRIDEALLVHPAEQWEYQVLEELRPGCSKDRLRQTEQQYINWLKTYLPEHGFNMALAWWWETPAKPAGRKGDGTQLPELPPPLSVSLMNTPDDVRLAPIDVAQISRQPLSQVENRRLDGSDGLTWIYVDRHPLCIAGSLKRKMEGSSNKSRQDEHLRVGHRAAAGSGAR